MITVRKSLVVVATLGMLAACADSVYALRVGWNVDIHMDKRFSTIVYQPGDPEYGDPQYDYANDFHLWGILESGDGTGANPPTFVSEVNFEVDYPGGPPKAGGIKFNTFNQQIGGAVDPNYPLPANSPWPGAAGNPQPPFYYFKADWTNPTANIPYSTWMHFGLEFDETCHNIGYWLQGTWTQDGVDPHYQPMYGFDVEDGFLTGERQRITIQNASDVETELLQMDLMILSKEEGEAFPLADLNTDFFETNPDWGNRWVSVPSSLLPTTMVGDGTSVDSFFDVFFDEVPGLPGLQPEGFVLARQYSSYEGGSTDYFWNYEIHGSHEPEPSTIVLLAMAGVSALFYVWRKRRTA